VPELPPLPEIFGNYTIRGITEVLGPEAISWFPGAPGWRYVALAVLVLLAWRGWRYWQKWRRNRYRRVALRQLEQLRDDDGTDLLGALSALLKATALQAYPRVEVAGLSGDNWLRWLHQHGNGASFSPTSATLLTESVYRGHGAQKGGELQTLRAEVRIWISAHREAGSA
jgi:hypothetical protein